MLLRSLRPQISRVTGARALQSQGSGREFKVVEVGPRDGLQNEKNFVPTEQKIELINRLGQSGLKVVECASYVSPKWVPQMKDNDVVINGIDRLPGVSYPVLVPNMTGMKNVLKNKNVEEIAVFAAASEGFSKKNTNCSIEKSLQRLGEVASEALKHGLRVRGYTSVVIACPYDGRTDPAKVAALCEALLSMGCYEVSLGDTIGVGSAASVAKMLDEVLRVAPAEKFAVHFHDTYGQALANVLVSVEKGIRVADSSVAGLGGCPYAKGATGNLASEDLVYMLHDMGFDTGIDLETLVETGEWICENMGRANVSRCSNALLTKKAKTK
ncbi:hypothetical protein QR680_017394 [Steinernema hermaphroditum]|uniref:hydroxymethylglutaryl-CoA lyase n=1 Tax=Steinernema hermaphroditum TaxID=289476 RepID=A0AA39HFL0_9BILA|nr:hypothetical protein QR680_017394 [Steinernema hermaphroditum]